MNPETSRAYAKIMHSPYGNLMGFGQSTVETWDITYGYPKQLPEEIKKHLKIAELSYREPWRFVKVSNDYEFKRAKFWDIADYKILGTLLGDTLLIQVGVERDGTKLVYTYQPSAWGHVRGITVSSFDAFMAQNQSPITWNKDEAKPARKSNPRTTRRGSTGDRP